MAEQDAIFLAASLGHVETVQKLVQGGLAVDSASEMVRAAIALRAQRRDPRR